MEYTLRFKVGNRVVDTETGNHGTVQAVLDEGYEVLINRQLWYMADSTLVSRNNMVALASRKHA
jgi:hypothetical protein